MMIDWFASSIGAWFGNRWFGAWFKRHPSIGWSIFVAGTIGAVAVLILLD